MLLREVEYAKPASVAEALGLLAENDGARALAGGQTLVNVMKARVAVARRARRPERARRAEGRSSSPPTGRSTLGAMTTYTEIVARAEAKARPILGEVCAQIADVQVRNRGTIGGNVCSNDPTNHLPPLMVALGARMTIAGAGGERDGRRGGLLPRRLHDRGRAGRAADEDRDPAGTRDGFAAVTIGADGTCIVNAPRPRWTAAARVALGCVDAVPHRARTSSAGSATTRTPWQAAVRGRRDLDPPSDVHASSEYRRHLAEVLSLRARRPGRAERAERSADGRRSGEPPHRGRGRTATTYEREVEARQLLIHFLRDDLDLTGSHIGCDTGNCGACSVIVDGDAREELHDARRPGRRRDASGRSRGSPTGDELTALQQAFQRAPRAPVRLLHARDADERDRAARRATRARARTRSARRCRATSAAAPATGTSSRRSRPRRARR